MKKVILMLSILMLNGCIYYVQPAQDQKKNMEVNSTQNRTTQNNSISTIGDQPNGINENNAPTSYSYPVPDRPHNINMYISNSPYTIDNNELKMPDQNAPDYDPTQEPVKDESVNNDNSTIQSANDTTNSEQSSDQPLVIESGEPSVSSSNETISTPQNVNNTSKATTGSSAPVGSYNNPISFDPNKSY